MKGEAVNAFPVNSQYFITIYSYFLDPEGGFQKATLVVLVVEVSSLWVQKSPRLS